MAHEYGENIQADRRVELHPGLDLWMRGARFGQVLGIMDGVARVKMDHPQVKRIQRIRVSDLKRID